MQGFGCGHPAFDLGLELFIAHVGAYYDGRAGGARVDQLRDSTVERDSSQAEVGAALGDMLQQLREAPLESPIIKAIAADLGDLESEAPRVTR